ncbi:hypothetical protein EBS43_03020 [bacterium]|nr:hypothetical protein [bacterium]
MLNLKKRIVFVFLLVWTAQAQALTLNQRWFLERLSPFDGINAETLATLKNRHVLFVSGIMNELADPQVLGFKFIKSYYRSNIDAIQNELGMSYDYYGPDSGEAVDVNSDQVYAQMMRAYSRTGKPLIVIAHSKGGAETLHAILKHPEVILNGYVDRVILVQAAIGGSPIATTTENRGVLYQIVSWFVHRGVKSLETAQSQTNFDSAFSVYQDLLNQYWIKKYGGSGAMRPLHDEVSQKIFYVRAHESREKLSWGIRTVNDVCGMRLYDDGRNDGLLMLKDQKHPRIGIDLGVLSSDHIGLTVDYYSNFSSSVKKAFTRAVVSQVYAADLELEDTSRYDEEEDSSSKVAIDEGKSKEVDHREMP